MIVVEEHGSPNLFISRRCVCVLEKSGRIIHIIFELAVEYRKPLVVSIALTITEFRPYSIERPYFDLAVVSSGHQDFLVIPPLAFICP